MKIMTFNFAIANGAAPKTRLNDSLSSGSDITTTPIAALSPYQNR